MERQEILTRAAGWMQARGWKRKLAKRRGYEQSLFEHSLNEIDALLQLLPILRQPAHLGLSEEEEWMLLVSVLAHDVGKEVNGWQAYIRGEGPWVPHVDPELTRQVVPEICQAMGFVSVQEPVQRVIENCVNLHMKHERGDAAVMVAVLQGSGRWRTLAEIVMAVDHFCSASSLLEARRTLEEGLLGRHVSATYHLVNLRGVSTTLLHRAAVEAFTKKGWRPILYFSYGTLYVAPAESPPAVPTCAEIRDWLFNLLGEVLNRDVADLMVGSPTGNILPKPDLFDFAHARSYLERAARKVGPKSFLTAYEREKKRVAAIGSPGRSRGKTKARVIQDYWKLTGKSGRPYSPEMDRDADRISRAHPEMLVFKFFKAMMGVDLVGQHGQAQACQHYEEIFGPGSWAELQSTSTLMAAQDMAKTIDRFWVLAASRFGLPHSRVEEMPDRDRQALLIITLEDIAQKVYAAIRESTPSPLSHLASEMARAFVTDLVAPTDEPDITAMARRQLEAYSRSKPYAGKQGKKGIYLCPICNSSFDAKTAVKGAADFIDKPESHTNRAVSHGSFSYITICKACYYDKILMQTLLGDRPAELLVLLPRMNIGYGNGGLLVQRVKEWVVLAQGIKEGDVNRGVTLGFTNQLASRLGSRDVSALTPEDLVELMTYTISDETKKKQMKGAEKLLRTRYEDSLEALNDEWGTEFTDWGEAVKALMAGTVGGHEAGMVRREAFHLSPSIHFVCETPNLIFVPLSYPIAANQDESDTNRALRQLFAALLIGMAFDVTVAILEEKPIGEGTKKKERPKMLLEFQGGEGVAYVPPVPAVRGLIGSEWVSLVDAEKWLKAIGAASLLARDTGFSQRSDLYQVLAEDPPERLVRRLEENLEEKGRRLTMDHIQNLEILREVRR